MASLINSFFQFQAEQFLSRTITKGCLILHHQPQPSNQKQDEYQVYGERADEAREHGRPVAMITLKNRASFYARLITQSDIGFAEAYMHEDFQVKNEDELVNIFRIFILNRDTSHHTSTITNNIISRVGQNINWLLHYFNRNTIYGSKKNIIAHYDLSNELFSTFLDSSWMYSCAIFDETKRIPLYEAQMNKIDKILHKAKIQKHNYILDIGCGWGELAIQAVTQYDCKVLGITLSKQQLDVAQSRINKLNLQHRIELRLIDYRQLTNELCNNGSNNNNNNNNNKDGIFDRIISIEMIEAVGHEFLGEYFSSINKLLKKPNGLVVIQAITTPDQRYECYRNGTDFIQKHIFPGGLCPSFGAIVQAVAHHTQLNVEHVENFTTHYATTLNVWRAKFNESIKLGKVERAGAQFDHTFIRKWMYYFCYCESGFATRTLGLLQIVLSPSNNVDVLGHPPAFHSS